MRTASLLQWIIALITVSTECFVEAKTVRQFVKELRTRAKTTATAIFIQALPSENQNEDPVSTEDARLSPSSIEGEDTTFTCPTIQLGQICSTEWSPVLCDGICQYGNKCSALASGYDADAQCIPYDESTELAAQSNTTTISETEEDCPIMRAGAYCTMDWDPFICDERCRYGNRCEASNSGYDVATQCRPDEF